MVVGSKLAGLVLAVGVVVGGIGWAGYRTSAETARMDQAAVSRDGQRSADSVPRRAVAVDRYGDALPEGAVARLGLKGSAMKGSRDFRLFRGRKNIGGLHRFGSDFMGRRDRQRTPSIELRRSPHGYAIGIGFSADRRTLAISDEVFANDNKGCNLESHTGKKMRVLTLPKGKGALDNNKDLIK